MKISIQDYKNVHFSHDAILLYLSRFLMQVAFGVVGIFLPIFFFVELNESFLAVVFIYIAIALGNAILTPIAAGFIQPWGMRRMMIMAIPLAMVAMGLLYFWDMNPLIVGALHIIFIIIYKSFYWIPYHVDFALFTNKKTRGRQLSILLNISEIALVLTPLFGGYVIATYGFGYIFIISPLLFLITIPPLFSISNPKEKYSFTYLNTFKQLFKKKNRPILVGYSADGAQSVVAAIIWPIFIFQLFNGEYLSVGIVTALTLIAIVVLRLLIGDIIDRWNRSKMITIGSIFYTTGWIIKIFVETAFQVFLVDTYHNIGKTVNRITFDTNTYTQSADNGHYIDEFTSLKEIALNIGRITMLSFVAVIVLFATIKVTFIAAAIATLFMTIINRAGVIK